MPIQLIIAVVLLIVSFILTAVLAPKPQDQKAAGLGEFDFPQVEDGTAEPVIFGDCWTEDWTVLWYGNLRTEAIHGKGKK